MEGVSALTWQQTNPGEIPPFYDEIRLDVGFSNETMHSSSPANGFWSALWDEMDATGLEVSIYFIGVLTWERVIAG